MFIDQKNKALYARNDFGVAMFNAQLPISVAADIIGVSRPTIYRWMEPGVELTLANGLKKLAFTRVVESMIAAGELPKLVVHRKELIELIKPLYLESWAELQFEHRVELAIEST